MSTPPAQRLAERAAETTPENPWPVRVLATKISAYVDKMSELWVEGQVVQLNRRPGSYTTFLVLRDPDADMSLSVTMPSQLLDRLPSPLAEGSRVVVRARPTFWAKRGTLQLEARDVRPVGVGDLLAQLERLKSILRSEGLFDADRKRPLPFLPRKIGLVTGRQSAAERDVIENTRRRWPNAVFVVHEVPVQGVEAVAAVSRAVAELDREREVDVIVIARGGGSFEDLLPFSNEALVRAVASVMTPVVSAIGHEPDTPLLDFVADVRASTPTDAAKLVVPDVRSELAGVAQVRRRMRHTLESRLTTERAHLDALMARPVMSSPDATLQLRREELERLATRSRQTLTTRIHRAEDQVTHLRAQVRALSPQATLDRGYAVVRQVDGTVVREQDQVSPAQLLRVTVAHGDFGVTVVGDTTKPRPRAARNRAKEKS